MDYRVNLRARGLVQKSSNVIGVIASDITNPTTSLFIDALSARFHEQGCGILLGNSDNDISREFEFIDLFTAKNARGIIFSGERITKEHVQKINNCPIPILIAYQEHKDLISPTIVFDDYRASYDVVRLLIKKGHRRIGFISCPMEDKHAGLLRRKAYTDAMNESNFKVEESWIQYADFTMESGYQAAERILEKTSLKPSVIFGSTDLIAIGALKFLKGKGYKIPEDIAVIGFDNIPAASRLVPSLSSVELDHFEMGVFSADMLSRIIKNSGSSLIKVTFRHKIILRESCP